MKYVYEVAAQVRERRTADYNGMTIIKRRLQMKKLAMFVFSILFAVAVPMAAMAHEGPGMHGGMACGMMKGGMMHGKGMEDRHGRFGMMGELVAHGTPWFYLMHAQELNLTGAQVASLKKISFEMKKDFITRGADVMLKRLDLKEAFDNPQYKTEEVQAKLKDLEDARLALETAVLKHVVEARDVLTPAQLKSLKTIIWQKGCGGSCCGKMKMNNGCKMNMNKMDMGK